MFLNSLIGLTILKIIEIEDYVQIEFSDQAILSIFNKFKYSAGLLSRVEGKAVTSVNENEEKAVISIEDSSYIEIGLRDEDFFGPEAMTLDREGKPTVVWN